MRPANHTNQRSVQIMAVIILAAMLAVTDATIYGAFRIIGLIEEVVNARFIEPILTQESVEPPRETSQITSLSAASGQVYDGLHRVEPEAVAVQDPTRALEYSPSYTDEDVTVLAKVVWAEARGLSRQEQAAVIWCILNRVDDTGNDYWPDTIIGVATQPEQFAYDEDTPVEDEFVALAIDVLERWDAEKHGCICPGRTLPKEYTYFFSRSTDENLFRTTYKCTGDFWDWSLPDPYAET